MKVTSLFLLLVFCACKTQPKTVSVAFNGSHGNGFLQQGCTVLQRDHDRISKLSTKEYVALLSLSGKQHMPCLFGPEVLNRGVENQLLTAFASNPKCRGVIVFQGYYDPKDATTEVGEHFIRADWRLSLDLTPSAETGDVSFTDSQWTLSPRGLAGPLADLEKATTDICRIAKGEGAQ